MDYDYMWTWRKIMEKDSASGRIPLTEPDYRKRVSSCASCNNPDRFPTPRFGLGKRDASIMVIAGAPTNVVPRGNLAGGHMLHYGAEHDATRTEADRVIRQLLVDLSIDTSDVYDTYAVKCPNAYNTPSSLDIQGCALKHLKYEVLDIRPKIIFCVGMTAVAGFFAAFPYTKFPECKTFPLGFVHMRVIGNVIELPCNYDYVDIDIMTYIVRREYRRIVS